MSKRYYDPNPYYDPDPDPGIGLIIALGLVVFGAVSWSQPNFLNNLLFTFNPELRELEAEKVKAQQEMWRILLLIIVAIAGIFILVWWFRHRKKKRR